MTEISVWVWGSFPSIQPLTLVAFYWVNLLHRQLCLYLQMEHYSSVLLFLVTSPVTAIPITGSKWPIYRMPAWEGLGGVGAVVRGSISVISSHNWKQTFSGFWAYKKLVWIPWCSYGRAHLLLAGGCQMIWDLDNILMLLPELEGRFGPRSILSIPPDSSSTIPH